MSFKEWSAAQRATAKNKPDAKPQDTPKANEPATQEQQTTTEEVPESKS
jgi:hypothetical protein